MQMDQSEKTKLVAMVCTDHQGGHVRTWWVSATAGFAGWGCGGWAETLPYAQCSLMAQSSF